LRGESKGFGPEVLFLEAAGLQQPCVAVLLNFHRSFLPEMKGLDGTLGKDDAGFGFNLV